MYYNNTMRELKDIKKIVINYVEEEFGENNIITGPIFMRKNNNYYLSFILLNEKLMPTKIIYSDILSGRINEVEDINLNVRLVSNDKSILYEYNDLVISSFNKYKEALITNIKIKKERSYESELLMIDGKELTAGDYISSNIEDILNDMKDILKERLRNETKEGHINYFNYLFNQVRDDFLENNLVNKVLNEHYLNFLKSTYPMHERLFDEFNNI